MPAPEAQEALIHLMVSMAAADDAISDRELREIGAIIETLPVFEGFDRSRLDEISKACRSILDEEDGIDRIIDNVRSAVPEKMHETAYALAIEVAASDVHATQSELRFLEMIRDRLALDPLATAAIEYSARLRYRRP